MTPQQASVAGSAAGWSLRPPGTAVPAVLVAGRELSAADLARWRADGLVVAVAGGVHLLADVAGDPCRRAAALAELLPRRGVAAGLAAAWVHGAAGPADPVDVVVPPGTGPAVTAVPGTRVRSARLAPGEVVRVAGVALTSPVRTAADLARGDPRTGGAALARLLAGGVAPAQVLQALAGRRHAARGREALAAALGCRVAPPPDAQPP